MGATKTLSEKKRIVSRSVANLVQPKLTIGQPDDEYEKEADRVARQVMRMEEPQLSRQPLEEEEEMIQPKTMIQQQPVEEEEEEELQAKPLIQMQPLDEEEEEELQPSLIQKKECVSCQEKEESANQINPQSHIELCGGQSLSTSTRNFFEPRFRQSFANVKVHTCDSAMQMNQNLNAQAFTYGNNIFFNRGKYNPETSSGRELLAHELTHVIQQKGWGEVYPTREKNTPEISQTGKKVQRAIQLAAIGALALRCAIGAVVSMLIDLGLQRVTAWWRGREYRHDWCSTIMSAITGCLGGMAVGAILEHMAATGVRSTAGPILGKILLWLVAQTAVTFPRHSVNMLLRLGCINENQARRLGSN